MFHKSQGLTPSEAFAVASQYGSYMRAGDPGAIFYSFYAGDGRPVSEEHRAALVEAVGAKLERALSQEPGDYDADELAALLAFFETSELQRVAA